MPKYQRSIRCFLFLFSCMVFSKLSCANILQTKVSIHASDKTIGYLLTYIENKYNVFFTYQNNLFDLDKKASLNHSDVSIQELLNTLFDKTIYGFYTFNNQIIIYRLKSIKENKEPIVKELIKEKIVYDTVKYIICDTIVESVFDTVVVTQYDTMVHHDTIYHSIKSGILKLDKFIGFQYNSFIPIVLHSENENYRYIPKYSYDVKLNFGLVYRKSEYSIGIATGKINLIVKDNTMYNNIDYSDSLKSIYGKLKSENFVEKKGIEELLNSYDSFSIGNNTNAGYLKIDKSYYYLSIPVEYALVYKVCKKVDLCLALGVSINLIYKVKNVILLHNGYDDGINIQKSFENEQEYNAVSTLHSNFKIQYEINQYSSLRLGVGYCYTNYSFIEESQIAISKFNFLSIGYIYRF